MLRYSAWTHVLLTAYLWVVACIPLGNWNRQRDPQLIPALLSGSGITVSDLLTLAFVTIPAVLFWLTYQQRRFGVGVLALVFDVFWLWMQVQSWWIPYLFGTNTRWQLEYAKGPTTKVLPSFGRHVAPDGMHFVIGILLVGALITGVIALRELKKAKIR
jgi:hypothetical protein